MSTLFENQAPQPLADQLRAQTLKDVVGQEHLTQKDTAFYTMLKTKLKSAIFWGPPGCGKTTLARLLAKETELHFEPLSAVFSGVADLRKVFDRAKERRKDGQGTLLFIDEIHRFNKAQQDAFLPYVEDGTITLIGATTENPSFELNAALLSRCHVFVLRRLDHEALEQLLTRAEEKAWPLPLTQEARETLKAMADGDGRYLLNMTEQLFDTLPENNTPLTPEQLMQHIQKRSPIYDKKDDSHYNLISAVHKSLRSSDTDAALYWVARMLDAGEDPKYLLRRLTRFANEDIGMADPNAITQALAAWETYTRLGSPEGDLAIAQLVIYLGTAPKSNAIYKAYGKAQRCAKETGSLTPPKHILNAPTKLMKELDYGKNYQYDHDTQEGFSGQNCFPDDLQRQTFYEPVERGFEREIKKRLDYWNNLRKKKT